MHITITNPDGTAPTTPLHVQDTVEGRKIGYVNPENGNIEYDHELPGNQPNEAETPLVH